MGAADAKLVLIDSLYYQYDLENRRINGAVFKPMVKNVTTNKIYRAFRKIYLSSRLPMKCIWLGNWQNDLESVSTVILADGGNSENVARFIHSNYPSKRIILWYRNSVEMAGQPSHDVASFCETWSFDRVDCDRYGYLYNPQFYGGNPSYREHPIEWDVFFVGQDKGRLDKILDIEARLKEAGLVTKFCIVGHNSNYLPYEQVIDNISRARAILDVQADWQDGLTLRPLEALFYKKKLITNSPVYATSDLYDRENVFLVDSDGWNGVRDFIRSEYIEPQNHNVLVRKYGIEGWLERFDQPGIERTGVS